MEETERAASPSTTDSTTKTNSRVTEELAIEEFRATSRIREKHANQRVWTTADYPVRDFNPIRPYYFDGRRLEVIIETIADDQRSDFVLKTLGLTDEHLLPYPTLDRDAPDIESQIDYIKLVSDVRYFIESFLWIDTKKQKVVPFKLNPVQLHFLFHRTGFDLINKGRQHGFTTLMLAYYLWNSIFNEATVTFIITHKKKATKKMIAKVRTMWECLPDCIRPALLIDQQEHLKFATGSEIICDVCDEAAGRSFKVNNLLCSEVAFWKIDDDKLSGLFESVPEGGSITLESTPNGIGNFFHRECLHCINPHEESAFKFFEYPWFWNPEYTRAWETWKKRQIKFTTERGKIKWYQEYCCSFEQSQRRFFGKEDCRPQAIHRTRFEEGPVGIDRTTGQLIFQKYPPYLYVFQEPVPGRKYVLGVDVAKGLEHGDFHSGTVLDRETREEVAHVYGKDSVEKLTEIVNWLGLRYNTALLAVEAQQDGLVVLSYLVYTYKYPNLFFHLDPLALNRQQTSPPLGWQMNVRTKKPMLVKFEKDVRTKTTLMAFWIREAEMLSFTRAPDGMPIAPEKMNDDTVISGAIANALLDYDDMIDGEEPELEVGIG